MAVTGEDVFYRAIKLIDEMDRSGTINESKIVLYRTIAPVILTTLQGELLPPSADPVDVTDLTADLAVTDKQARYVLPYGLASEMMIAQDDDETIATFFSRRYADMKLRYPVPVTSTTVQDVYGVTVDPSGGSDIMT